MDDQQEIPDDYRDPGSVTEDDYLINNDDDEWSDHMSLQCSGVADILVTGEVRTFDFHGIGVWCLRFILLRFEN